MLLSCYRESLVQRMARYTPEIETLIDRTRFIAVMAEPSWVLRGLRGGNPFWFTVGLGTARDIMPVGSG